MEKCKCGKEFEKKSSLKTHARFCSLYEKQQKKIFDGKCECGKIFEKVQSLNAHYSHCLVHRNGKDSIKRGGGWTGITKEIRELSGKTLSDNIRSGKTIASFKGKHHSVETRQVLSTGQQERVFNNGFIKTKFYEVFCPFENKIVKVQGTWELKYSEWLNSRNIDWIKSKKHFINYIKDDVMKTYYPDFFLVNDNTFIEIKGYFWPNDRIKMDLVINQNPNKNIVILTREHLLELGVL